MCGRFSLGASHDDIHQMHGYNVQVGEWVDQEQYVPRYNIAPRSRAPVIRRRQRNDGAQRDSAADTHSGSAGPSQIVDVSATPGDTDASLVLHTMKWGLVPHWSKHEDLTMSTTNARSEALVEGGGMWGSIKGRKRCAIPCDGYYEWLKKGKERLPHFTKRKDGRLLLLAGLYDCVTLEGSTEPLWTFTIVTTDANKEFSWLHDRQPVMLPNEEALTAWLDTSSGSWSAKLSQLCTPYHDTASPLACYQVPKEVGKVGTESPTFIQPVAERKDGIQAMFEKQAHAKPKPATASSTADAGTHSEKKQALKRSASREPVSPGPKKQKLNAWEDDSYIEYLNDPPVAANTARAKDRPGPVTPSKTKKAGKVATKSPQKGRGDASGSAKITSFFGKT